MAYYIQDTRRVLPLTGGLSPMWRWKAPPPHRPAAAVPPPIVGLWRVRGVVGVVGMRRARQRAKGLAGGRIVDKSDPPEDELVKVDGKPLQRDCAAALEAMTDEAYRDGIKAPLLTVQSGYRSSKLQARLFAQAVKRYGTEAKARKWVAAPGGSAHESGCAVDLYLGKQMGTTPAQLAALRDTAAHKWLQANASRFGWAPYSAEPWHWECDADCKAEARRKWGNLVDRGKARARHALDVVQANPGKSAAGAGMLIAVAVALFFMLRGTR